MRRGGIVTHRQKLLLSLLGGSLLGGASLWLVADRVIATQFERLRPVIEARVSEPLGHPVSLGRYRGLGFQGISFGPIAAQAGSADQSTAAIERLSIGFNPLESLLRLRPVLPVRVQGVQLDLRRNAQGAYWVPGPLPQGGSPPRLDLQVRLIDPARIRIAPAGLTLSAAGWSGIQLDERRAQASLQLMLPDRGRVMVRGEGRWDQPEVELSTRLERLQLGRYQGLLPDSFPVQLKGQLGGQVRLAWRDGRPQCDGGLSLADVTVSGESLDHSLQTPQLRLSCLGDQLSLPTSRWVYGPYQARLGGGVRLNRSFDLKGALEEPNQDRRLAFHLDGAWRQPRVRVDGRWALPSAVPLDGPMELGAELQADWRQGPRWSATLEQLDLRAPGLVVEANGALHPRLNVTTQQLQLAGPAWKRLPLVPKLLGTAAPVSGVLTLSGQSVQPEVALSLQQTRNPLLKEWSLQGGWTAQSGLLRLEQWRSPELIAEGQLPLVVADGGIKTGDLQASLQLEAYPLERLGPLLGTVMDGTFSASGAIRGPLRALRPDLQIAVVHPRAGALRLMEDWSGRFEGRSGGGGALSMASVGSVIPGALEAQFGSDWMPSDVLLRRRNGQLRLQGTPADYRWTATNLAVDGLELALPPKQRWEGIYGLLSGQGSLGLQPLAMQADLTLKRPGLMGVQLQQILLSGRYSDRRYSLTGELLPPDTGQITLEGEGRVSGAVQAQAVARGVSARWLSNSAFSLLQLSQDLPLMKGTAADLGTLLMNTFGGTLDGQLRALRDARDALLKAKNDNRDLEPFHLEDLRGQLDAVIDLQGPEIADLNLELNARGHLWLEGDDADYALQVKPFTARLEGPLVGGEGRFSLAHLPFALLGLVAPMPAALKGALGMRGTYRLNGANSEITSELVLEDAKVGPNPIAFQRSQVLLKDQALTLDLALTSQSSSEPVTVTGRIPLVADQPLDVRVVSLGDGLRFLTGLSNDAVTWNEGEVDLRLLLGGTLGSPKANGYVVIKDGAFEAQGQSLAKVNGSMVFDFDRLEVQSLTGRFASGGQLTGSGALSLLKPVVEPEPLRLQLEKARIKVPVADVEVGADLIVTGALVNPQIGGRLEISHGAIKPRRTKVTRDPSSSGQDQSPTMVANAGDAASATTVDALLEEQWTFNEPLVLQGADVEADTSRSIKAAMPKLPFIGFRDLRLSFGPKLRVEVPFLATFKTKGLLTVNGALDPNLQLRGVVELLSGRVSMFTTTFTLDRRASNVAVFTPSMGLIPYVDVAMTTRVSDNVTIPVENDAFSTTVFDSNGLGNLGAGGQLRLIKVLLVATGPADRLVQNIQLRSTPALSQPQLMALIGGNSLAGLSGAGAGTAIAAVLGQSLLSPVLGTLTDAFSQRLQFALYPTYVTPVVQSESERISGQVPPQLALVTDIGVSVTDRFDFSVLAAPNRNDIPAQSTLTYQINSNLSASGSVDTQGTWQSQLQLFFRF